MKTLLLPLFAVLATVASALADATSPLAMCTALEARMAAGDGVTLPDANAEIVRHAGSVDLARGDWPEAFVARAGETVCVAVSPFTGCYEFFDESGECFYTLVPVLATTENWVAPFRHAVEGTFPDDNLYATPIPSGIDPALVDVRLRFARGQRLSHRQHRWSLVSRVHFRSISSVPLSTWVLYQLNLQSNK